MVSTVHALKSAFHKIIGRKEEAKEKKKIKPVRPKKIKVIKKAKKVVPVKPVRKPHVKKIIKAKMPKKKKEIKTVLPPALSKNQALKLLKYKEAAEFIIAIAGKEGFDIYKYLVQQPGEIDEFTLADKVKLQINFARSLLYKLYEQKLVSFSRERDKKKGWFIYSWQSHPYKLKSVLLQKKQEEVQKLGNQLTADEDKFVCIGCSRTFDYATAMETMFFCSICGGKLEAINSFEMREKIKKQIAKLKLEIAELEKV